MPVPAGVLEAAALLLTELADSGDDAVRLTAATTRDHLLAALATASPTANAVKTP
ncbi:hypothetical protein ACF068_31155 [Streptomyces sp. NPDC016309]|uniref:hypothetical protein n=1 Tax=Streptomyces sp. NPDC016309 TaxID=3364965 RepID=UPI0036FE18CA